MNTKLKIIDHLLLTRNKIDDVFSQFYENRSGNLFTYFNQNSFNIFWTNQEYRQILDSFNIYQEGIGLFLAFKISGVKDAERIDSTEVLEKMIKFLISKGEKVIFIGGRFEENELLKRCKMVNLNVEYYHHGYFELTDIDDLISELKSKDAKFILVGMGTPKQELVAFRLSQYLPDKKFICIGNFMNFFLGYQRRAPLFVRKAQLEWLFRFFQEPRRLFSRYVLGIPLFFGRIITLLKGKMKL